jgi:hypothetical protein
MSQYRLHIDIPLGVDEQGAIDITEYIMERIKEEIPLSSVEGLNEVNYRLGHDEDRQKSNYLNKTPDGHITKKKCKIIP